MRPVRSIHIHVPLVYRGTLTFIYILHRSTQHLRVTQKNIGASEGRLLSSTSRSFVACAAEANDISIPATSTREESDSSVFTMIHAGHLAVTSIYKSIVPQDVPAKPGEADDGSFSFSHLRVVASALIILAKKRDERTHVAELDKRGFVQRRAAARKKCSNWIYRGGQPVLSI